MWGKEQGSTERFGQRGDVVWFGNEGLLRQRGVKGALSLHTMQYGEYKVKIKHAGGVSLAKRACAVRCMQL